jgi:hypothetical protein
MHQSLCICSRSLTPSCAPYEFGSYRREEKGGGGRARLSWLVDVAVLVDGSKITLCLHSQCSSLYATVPRNLQDWFMRRTDLPTSVTSSALHATATELMDVVGGLIERVMLCACQVRRQTKHEMSAQPVEMVAGVTICSECGWRGHQYRAQSWRTAQSMTPSNHGAFRIKLPKCC